mmetsp:Transcript_7723/g.22627  ORF Transcript_7723/g.22627 Transcript_7723/m.22627 type:complete len:82 (+) Transcript_7723:1261-1506(+)
MHYAFTSLGHRGAILASDHWMIRQQRLLSSVVSLDVFLFVRARIDIPPFQQALKDLHVGDNHALAVRRVQEILPDPPGSPS